MAEGKGVKVETMEKVDGGSINDNDTIAMEEPLVFSDHSEEDKRLNRGGASESAGTGSTGPPHLPVNRLDGHGAIAVQQVVTPIELQAMDLKDSFFDWEKVSTVMKEPICWKCHTWGTFFSCEGCGRHFHRECVFMNPQFPNPVFDKSLEEACHAAWGEVCILKCPICIVSQETRVPQLRSVTQEDLNKALFYVTKLVLTERGGDILEKFPCAENAMTVNKILEKAANKEYKTVEGYFADFKTILYDIISKYSLESEATIVGKTEINAVSAELRVMAACFECTMRRFSPDGKLLPRKEYDALIKLRCNVPHVVIWVKDGVFSYWPAKVLGFDSLDGVKIVVVQYFGEKCNPLFITLSDPNYKLMRYSKKYPGGKKPTKTTSAQAKSWRLALSLCEGYLANHRTKYGNDGVIILDESEEFPGDLELRANILKMFPKYIENSQA